MRPTFELTSSTDPADTSCTATWQRGCPPRNLDIVTTVTFATNADAFAIDRLVGDAYAAGMRAGRTALAGDVAAVLNGERP